MALTSVQCKKSTLKRLGHLKYEEGLVSYDALLNKLVDYWRDTHGGH